DPSPLDLLHQLISLNKRFILIIDNCSSLLHRKLSSIITSIQNQGCLITVEYDIRDDQPDETDVYKLEPASSELIEQLLRTRFEYIHEINVRKIAEFAGGNARIAIALANTIVKGQKMTILRDEDLFERLFYQRHSQSHNLLRSAEVCSLIYSFDIQTSEGNELEINLLSKLASKPLEDLFADISELKRRDLIQQRGFWRAVLPHAIANRLAIRALENIPMDNILNIFENGGSERLLLSFSRRLGFLHESLNSKNIANKWFSFGGMLHNLSELGSIKLSILRNVAPIVPGIVLDTIEKTASIDTADTYFSISNEDRIEITRLLRLIAYEQIYFERCIKLLVKFALMEKANYTSDSSRKLLSSLFYLRYSGTHALADQRLKIIDSLLQSTITAECELGLLLMGSALETNAYGSIMNFEFGALQRDYGYYPANAEEIREWYSFFLKYLMKLYSENLEHSKQIRSLIAEKFRNLWNCGYVIEELAALIEIFSLDYWGEGWVTVSNVIIYDSAEMEQNLLSRLLVIEDLLKPKTLLDRLRTYLFLGNVWNLKKGRGEDVISGGFSFENEFLNLTRELTFDKSILEIILGEVSKNGSSLSNRLGQGLALNANDPLEIWQLLLSKYRKPNESEIGVINGFLFELYKLNLDLINQIYDDLLQDNNYSLIFPCFQLATPLDFRALKRLEHCIDSRLPQIEAFKGLIFKYEDAKNLNINISDILDRLLTLEGADKVVPGLFVYLAQANPELTLNSKFIILGRKLIRLIYLHYENRIEDEDQNSQIHYFLEEISTVSLSGKDAELFIRDLCDRFIGSNLPVSQFNLFIQIVAKQYPNVFIEKFLNAEQNLFDEMGDYFSYDYKFSKNPLNSIDEELILHWCKQDPDFRTKIIASIISPFEKDQSGFGLGWTKLSLSLIDLSNNPVNI
ncbi:hypothetical protein JWG44_10675, partial [Leptospira sp. 201903071]|uniref:hypothetical protein n=1 Tax=Leptospira ainazelensis TaxID=2810034 RepID=UPI0019645163